MYEGSCSNEILAGCVQFRLLFFYRVVITILVTLVIFGTIVDTHSRIVKDDDNKARLQK